MRSNKFSNKEINNKTVVICRDQTNNASRGLRAPALVLLLICTFIFQLSSILDSAYAHNLPLDTDLSIKSNSVDLIVHAASHDGQMVSYEGEAIGDLMLRGEENWINIYDGKNAIGVVLSAEQAKLIQVEGDYKDRGDMVLVTGQFNESCELHRGELDIHAEELLILEKGRRDPPMINKNNMYIAFFSAIWASIAFYLSRRRHNGSA